MTYAVCCKKCGHIENTAWIEHEGRRIPSAEPLTPRGHVPIYCQKCGERDWRVPATADDITDYEAKNVRLARATELCRSTNLEGLLKIPEEVRASAEVKNAIGNLLAPLEGETLRAAQSSCIKVARSGLAISMEMWVEYYDKAIAKAVQDAIRADVKTKAKTEVKTKVSA